MNVIVLGCGPSGLVAANTAHWAGHEVRIFSRPQKSEIHGAQFLHQPINRLETASHWVTWQHSHPGNEAYDPTKYLRKVYGAAWDGNISDEMYREGQRAWDLRYTYDELWNKWGHRVHPWQFSMEALHDIIRVAEVTQSRIINTLPRKLFCVRPQLHNFIGTAIWAHGENQYQPAVLTVPDMTIIYNGEQAPTWYRASRVYGHTTVEWPGDLLKPPIQGVVKVTKPVRTNCDCWQDQIHHVGRFGLWRKGVLLHHVQKQTDDILALGSQEALF